MKQATHRAPLAPSTFDPDAYTIEAVISTGAPVPRRDVRGIYSEVLELGGVKPSSLERIPVTDGHKPITSTASRDVVGTIVSARREGENLVAVIQLSRAPDVASTVTKITEGTVRGVSIGYNYSDPIERVENGKRVKIISPKIYDVSIVPRPADPACNVRSSSMNEDAVIEELTMSDEEARQVRTMGEWADLPPSVAEGLITRGATLEEARTEIRSALVERSRTTPRIRVVSPAAEDPAVQTANRSEAIYCRMSGTAPSAGAREFMSARVVDHAAWALQSHGISTRGMTPDEVLTRAAQNTVSDFPLLVSSAANKTLQGSYQVAQSPVMLLAKRTTHQDFKGRHIIKVGDFGPLEKVSESGEITATSRAEAGEFVQLATYARKINYSRRLMIDDDLSALGDATAAFGRSAAETEANILVSRLLANPVLREDDEQLFSPAHGNLAASGAPPGDGQGAPLWAARKALRKMKGLDGTTPINAVPKYLVVGPELEQAGEQVLANIYAATIDDVNANSGKLTLLVEPRIPGSKWFVFADPAALPCLEIAHLSSAPGPQIESRAGWEHLGMSFRCVLDFAAAATDFRGAYHNPGS